MKCNKLFLPSFMIGIFLIMISGCSSTKHHVIKTPHIQKAYLYDAKKQKEIIAKNQADNAYTKYVSDYKQFGLADYWNINIYKQVQQLKADILSGIAKKYDQVAVDCDDTDIEMQIGLLHDGYPADQITSNFYLVPPSTAGVTGVRGVKLGGHLAVVADVEGDFPMSLEDISQTRYQKDIESKLGYYAVAYYPASENFKRGWVSIDIEGYKLLRAGDISVDEAKARPLYQLHTQFVNQRFYRKEHE